MRCNQKKGGKTFFKMLCFLLIFVLVFFVFSNNACFAVGLEMEDTIKEASALFQTLGKFVYILLWPILVIAGTAMDNTLVYGKFLNLDSPLRTLWQIIKNFANFALGFMVLFSIVKNLLTGGGIIKAGNDKWSPKKIITNTLIAGVLIQFSWFLVAAMLDISTILIYSIGGMPMSVLKSNPEYTNKPLLTLNTSVSPDENGKLDAHFYYSYGNRRISECLIRSNIDGLSGSYIVGKKEMFIDEENYFDTGYCAVWGVPYRYLEAEEFEPEFSSGLTVVEKNKEYVEQLINYVNNNYDDMLENCNIIPKNMISGNCFSAGYGMLSSTGNDVFFTGAVEDQYNKIFSLDSLINKSKNFVGPFVSMYSSLLNYQSLISTYDTNEDYMLKPFFSLLLTTFFAVVLFIPIVILAVLLIVRIGKLWFVVVISPILILSYVFGIGKETLKAFTLKEVLKTIFSPILIVFAISLSMIFLQAVNSVNPKPGNYPAGGLSDTTEESQLLSTLGIKKGLCEGGSCTYSIMGLTNITLTNMDVGSMNFTVDVFVWLIMMLISTGIVRFFVLAAIKMTGKLGETLGKQAETLGKYAPIIPIAGGVGYGTLKDNLPNVLGNRIDKKFVIPQNRAFSEQFGWLTGVTPPENTGQNIEISDDTKNEIKAELEKGKSYTDLISGKALLTQKARTELEKLGGGDFKAGAAQVFISNIQEYPIYTALDEDARKQITETGMLLPTSRNSVDALILTSAQLDLAVKTDPKWKAWAESMLGGAVHTADGVRMVDNIGTTQFPLFAIETREEYERRNFGEPVKNITENEMAKLEDAKKQSLEEYKKSVQKSYDNLIKILKDLKDNTAKKADYDKLLKQQQADLDLYKHLGIQNNTPIPPTS